ncbi:MAG TPA: hypothetical protein VE623_07295 [Acidimicrobiales bacterium]|nr:hypothetical protein [Acidimicrobiales bacterium]
MSEYPVEEFVWGLGAGVVALVLAGAMASRDRRSSPGGRGPVTGVLMAAAALGAIWPSRAPTAGVLLGLGGVTAACVLATRQLTATAGSFARRAVTPLAAVPFAWLLAIDASSVGWVRAVVVTGATLGPIAAARTDATWGSTGLPPGLYAITAAGVFAAVPNTREAAALLGASTSGALAGWPLGRARLGQVGAAATTALMVWVAAVGAQGREPAIVGAVACLGLIITLPVGRYLAARWPPRQRPSPLVTRAGRRMIPQPLLAVAAHISTVAVASRVAGITAELRVALPVAAGTGVAALVASTLLERDTARVLPQCSEAS